MLDDDTVTDLETAGVLRRLRKAEKDLDSVSVKLREGRLQSLEMSVKS